LLEYQQITTNKKTKGKPKGNQRETKGKPKGNQRETESKPL
jgi:hypothetical protein